MPPKPSKTALETLKTLREHAIEVKKDASHVEYQNRLKEIRNKAMRVYRRHSDLISKEDLLLFSIIIKKGKLSTASVIMKENGHK